MDTPPLYAPIRKDGPTQSATHVDAVGDAIEPFQPRGRRKKKKVPVGTEMNYTPALADGGGLDVLKYDDSEPRDDSGKWTSGGGSAGRTGSTPSTPHSFKSWAEAESWGQDNGIVIHTYMLEAIGMKPENMALVADKVEAMDRIYPGIIDHLDNITDFDRPGNATAGVSLSNREEGKSDLHLTKKFVDACNRPGEFREARESSTFHMIGGQTHNVGFTAEDIIAHEMAHVVQNFSGVKEPATWKAKTNPYVKAAAAAGWIFTNPKQGTGWKFGSGQHVSEYAGKNPTECHAEVVSLRQNPELIAEKQAANNASRDKSSADRGKEPEYIDIQEELDTYARVLNELTGKDMVKAQGDDEEEDHHPGIVADDFGLTEEFWERFYELVRAHDRFAKYDPSQPRDEKGRFGSSSSAPYSDFKTVASVPLELGDTLSGSSPIDDYCIDPFFFSIAVEDRMREMPIGKKMLKADALGLAKNLLTHHGFQVFDTLTNLPEGVGDNPKTVVLISDAKYFKPPWDPDAAAFVTPLMKATEQTGGVAMVIDPKNANEFIVIHELAHVIAGDPQWHPEGVHNPHRLKWLDTYAKLLGETQHQDAAKLVHGFASSVRGEAERNVEKSAVTAPPLNRPIHHCLRYGMDISTGDLIPLPLPLRTRKGRTMFSPFSLSNPFRFLKLNDHDVSQESRDPGGKWTAGAGSGKVAAPAKDALQVDPSTLAKPVKGKKPSKPNNPQRQFDLSGGKEDMGGVPSLTLPTWSEASPTNLWDTSKLSTDIVPTSPIHDLTSDMKFPSRYPTAENPSGPWVTQEDTAPDSQFKPSNPISAAIALSHAQKIELDTVDDLDNVIDGINILTTQYDDAEIPDDKRPIFDLAKVDFKGKPLIASTSKGIRRDDMPQLKGFPRAGSPTENMPRDKEGKVDLEDTWLDHLRSMGVKVEKVNKNPEELKSTQWDMNGAAIAGIFAAVMGGKFPTGGAWISSDGYVVDGHHRWASDLLIAARTGRATSATYTQIDIPINKLIKMTNDYVREMGISGEPASAAGITGPKSALRAMGGYEGDVRQNAVQAMIDGGGFTFHPKSGEPPSTGFMVGMKDKDGKSLSAHIPFDPSSQEDRIKLLRAIKQFAMGNFKLFGSNPNAYIGGWYDENKHEVVLDPSENVDSQEEAVRMGTERNEQSIWDVVNGVEISTGGTGGDVSETSVGKATSERHARGTGSMGGGLRPVRAGPDPSGSAAARSAAARSATAALLLPITFTGRQASPYSPTYIKSNDQHDDRGRFTSSGAGNVSTLENDPTRGRITRNPDYHGTHRHQLGQGTREFPVKAMMPPALAENLGRCYELAADKVVLQVMADTFGGEPDRGDVLVHGTIQGAGNPPLDHAWVQSFDGSKMWEPATDSWYTADAFNKLFNPRSTMTFSAEETRHMMVSSKHYGPWVAGDVRSGTKDAWTAPSSMATTQLPNMATASQHTPLPRHTRTMGYVTDPVSGKPRYIDTDHPQTLYGRPAVTTPPTPRVRQGRAYSAGPQMQSAQADISDQYLPHYVDIPDRRVPVPDAFLSLESGDDYTKAIPTPTRTRHRPWYEILVQHGGR